MQNQRRENEQDLRRFLYPRKYEREDRRSPARKVSNNSEFVSKKPKLHFQYDDQQSSSSYILNKEMNLNAQGYPRDEVHFSVLDNNNKHYSYLNKSYKPEGKIYHYSIASRKDYSRDKNDEYNTYYYPERRARKYYIEKKIPLVQNDDYINNYERQEENILPTKVYISDSYAYNKSGTYKFRPSREKDGYNEYKGGIVNLRRKKYTSYYEINSIILIQRWWRNILNIIRRSNERYESDEYHGQNQYYTSVASRKAYSRGNERIIEKIIPGENDKFIIQTTKVEVYRSPYMNIPLLKPEIITKEVKLNSSPKKNNIEVNNDFEIILDKESLKQNMRNIWNEECISTLVDSLSIIQKENIEQITEISNNTIINKYEEQIKQLKISLSEKENKLIEFSNKLKTLSSNKEMEIEENYFKEEEPILREKFKSFKNKLKIQLVDRLLIRNTLNLEGYNKLYVKPKNKYLIENNYNICIFPMEKEPLKKQSIDKLFIEGSDIFNNKDILSIYRGKKINEFKFAQNKMIIDPKDNLEILPIEREPLKKQLVDDLYIEGLILMKPENKIQNIDKLTVFRTARPQNIIEVKDNIQIISLKKDREPLKKQLVDDLYIEGLMLMKPENKIQNIDKLIIPRIPKKIENIAEFVENIEILSKEKEPLKIQLVDDLYIERLLLIKHENKVQNIDKLSIFRTPKPVNVVEPKDNLEILRKEKEPLKKQLVDDLYIEKLINIKPENKMQVLDKIEILRIPKNNNVIVESRDNIEILPKPKKPLKLQLIDSLSIEGAERPNNEIQSIDKINIFKTPKTNLNMIEERDNIHLYPKEKEPLTKQLVDDLMIERYIIKSENKIQNIDKIIILKTPKPENTIEEKDNIFISPKIKEPMKNQNVDSLIIEGIIRPVNKIQEVDKIEILRAPKSFIISIEEKDTFFIPRKEKEPFEKQLVDDLMIEKNIKNYNYKVQNIDKIEILKSAKPKNIIEEKDNIFIESKKKEPLKSQLIDNIIVEGIDRPKNNIQNVDKIEILRAPKSQNIVIEEKDSLFISRIIKEPFKNQNVDSIIIEGNIKQENKIQEVDKMEILRTSKPINIMIEENDRLFIPSKEKIPLKNQVIDKITIEGIEYPDNKIQKVDKIEILRDIKPKNIIIEEKDSIFIPPKEKALLKQQRCDKLFIEKELKPENKIQKIDDIEIIEFYKSPRNIKEMIENESIFISPKEKKPLKNVNVDSIIIEGNDRPENKIQNIDKMEILRISKPINIIIEENDSLFIPSKEKIPLKNQIVDKIMIEGIEHPESKIQNVDKIEILRTHKPINIIIEQNDNLFVPHKEKEPLKSQNVDKLLIEGKVVANNQIQNVDKIEILRTSKPKSLLIEGKDSIFIPQKEKDPLKSQIVDNIEVEGNIRPENNIQNIDKFEILRTSKPKNLIIEGKDNIFIPQKEKEPLKSQIVDSIEVEGNIRPENNIQNIDKIEILTTPKPKNLIIEGKDNIFIPQKEKEPLKSQTVDNIAVEGNIKPENNIQNIDKIEILRTPKPENIIEEKDIIFIEREKKINEPLKNQLVDSIVVEGINRPENNIQNINKIEILKTPKPSNKIEPTESIFIEPKEKKPLQNQLVSELLIESEEKPQNEMMNIDKINIFGNTQKLRDENMIQQNSILFIEPKEKKPLIKQKIDDITVEGLERPDNEIQVIENKMEILKAPRHRDMIEEVEVNSIFIGPKIKPPLEYQLLDHMIIEGIEMPENEIEKIDKINIICNKLKGKNKNNNIIEPKDSIFIDHKKQEPLQIQILDYMLVEGIERPEYVIEEVNVINILRDNVKKNCKNNLIEPKDNIYIEAKEKEPLQKQVIDYMLIEGIERPPNIIEEADKIELLRTPRKKNMIEEVNYIKIEPQEKIKENIKRQKVDELKVEGLNLKYLISTFSGDKNIPQTIDKFKILPLKEQTIKKQSYDNDEILSIPKSLESENIFILKKKKEPFVIERLELYLKGEKKEEAKKEEPKKEREEVKKEEEEKEEEEPKEEEEEKKDDINKIILRKRYSRKNDNIIEGRDRINIIAKEKEEKPLEVQSINSINYEKIIKENKPIKRRENEIEKKEEFKIIYKKKSNVEEHFEEGVNRKNEKKPKYEEEEVPNIKMGKIKEPLKEDKMDNLFIEANKKPINKIANENKIFIPCNRKKEEAKFEKIPQKDKNEIIYLDDIYIPSKEKKKVEINEEEVIRQYILKKGKKEIKHLDDFMISSIGKGKEINKEIKKEIYETDKMDELIFEGLEKPENTIEKSMRFKILNEAKPKVQYEVEYMEDIFFVKAKKKEEIILKKESMDKLSIEGDIKQENEIERTQSLDILRTPKPKNEIKNIDEIFIPPEPIKLSKQQILLKDNNIKDLYIKSEKKLTKSIILPCNEINSIEPIFIPSKNKEPLLEEHNDLYIEGNKLLKGARKIEFKKLIKDNNIIDFYLKGIENENKIKDNEISLKKKEPLLKDKIDNLYFERSPRSKNEIKNVDKLLIPSKPSKKIEPLSKDKISTFYIEGIKKEDQRILPKNEINSLKPIFISSKEKEALKTQVVSELYIENKGEKEKEIKKESKRVFINNSKENKDQIFIKGKPKEESVPLSIKRNDNLKENIDNITLNGLDRPENKYKKEIELNILKSGKENKINEICSKNNDVFIEGNEDQLEIIILKRRNRKLKEEIKPNSENRIFIPGISKSKVESSISKNIIKEPVKQFTIIGKESKPFIIENKGNFKIDSNRKLNNYENNLIVQGSCFGLLAKPNEPGLETQDIETIFKNNWKNKNQKQKTCELALDGDNNNRENWNNNIIQQKCFKFTIDKSQNYGPLNIPFNNLKIVKEIRLDLLKNKEDEIMQDDYNYINLERDDKQRRTVKATITKVYRGPSGDDDNQEIDPFSGLSKHSNNKYDKIFNKIQERKNSSNKKNISEGKSGTVIIKGSNDKKIGKLLFKDMKKSGTDERKMVSDLFKDINERNSESGGIINYKNKVISRSQVMFKPKEKKTEYLRDYDNEPQIYS